MDVRYENPAVNFTEERVLTMVPVQPKDEKPHINNAKEDPKVGLGIDDKEVKRCTGFPTREHLLLYIFKTFSMEA